MSDISLTSSSSPQFIVMAAGGKWISSDEQAFIRKSLEDDLIQDLGRVPSKLHLLVLVMKEMLYELSIGGFDSMARRRFWVRTMALIGHRHDLATRFFRYILRPRPSPTHQPNRVFQFRLIPPAEYSLISFTNDAKALLNPEEFRRFMHIVEDAQRAVFEGRYGAEKSRETLRRLMEVSRHHEPLLRRLSEISWEHLRIASVESQQIEHPNTLTLHQNAPVLS